MRRWPTFKLSYPFIWERRPYSQDKLLKVPVNPVWDLYKGQVIATANISTSELPCFRSEQHSTDKIWITLSNQRPATRKHRGKINQPLWRIHVKRFHMTQFLSKRPEKTLKFRLPIYRKQPKNQVVCGRYLINHTQFLSLTWYRLSRPVWAIIQSISCL